MKPSQEPRGRPAQARPDRNGTGEGGTAPGLLHVVQLARALPEHGVAAAAEGTVVEVFPGDRPAYLVEFSDDEGATLAELVLEPDQLNATWRFAESRAGVNGAASEVMESYWQPWGR